MFRCSWRARGSRRALSNYSRSGSPATIVSLAILAVGARLIHEGHDAAGATVVGLDMASVITAFLFGTMKRRKERENKAAMQAKLARR